MFQYSTKKKPSAPAPTFAWGSRVTQEVEGVGFIAFRIIFIYSYFILYMSPSLSISADETTLILMILVLQNESTWFESPNDSVMVAD